MSEFSAVGILTKSFIILGKGLGLDAGPLEAAAAATLETKRGRR